MDLFFRKYDNYYLRKLQYIGFTHERIGLNAHCVNCSMNFVRQSLTKLIRDSYYDTDIHQRLTVRICWGGRHGGLPLRNTMYYVSAVRTRSARQSINRGEVLREGER